MLSKQVPLGIYEKALPAGECWLARLQLAKQLGFDFVEMSVDETDERLSRLDWSREQRLALEQSASLNEAYQTLKNPPKRARYLLALQGGELPLEVTVHDPEFLMQQMQWREELEDLHDSADMAGIEAFKRRLKVAQSELNDSFAACWDDAAQREQAERLMRRMQFLDKLTYEVRQLEERLDD